MWSQDGASRQGARRLVGWLRDPLGTNQWLLVATGGDSRYSEPEPWGSGDRMSLHTLPSCATWSQARARRRPGNSQDQSRTSRAKLGSCLTLREGTSEGGDRTLMTAATAHQDMPSSKFLMVPPGGPGLSCQGGEHSGPVASTDLTLFPEVPGAGSLLPRLQWERGGGHRPGNPQLWVLDWVLSLPQFLQGAESSCSPGGNHPSAAGTQTWSGDERNRPGGAPTRESESVTDLGLQNKESQGVPQPDHS